MFKHMLLGLMSLFLVVGVFAKGPKAEAKQSGKVTVVISHEVKDYATWKKGYDAHEPVRKKGGFNVSGVYSDVKNPNMVTVIGQFPSAAAAEEFFTNPEMKETMSKVGVIGKPEMKILAVGAK
jgi:quinol monooxygenase YgiN